VRLPNYDHYIFEQIQLPEFQDRYFVEDKNQKILLTFWDIVF